MKDKWRIRYRESVELMGRSRINILTGFNANIDLLYSLEDLKLNLNDVDAEIVNPVENLSDLKSNLKYCAENGQNQEVNGEGFHEVMGDGADKRIGGQAGIIANYLSGFDNYVAFHTPLLSDDLAEMMNSNVVSPVVDGKLLLKRVQECTNTDRTKKNTIIEFNGEKTGRLIVSDKLRGFGPYFRKGVEENFEVLEDEMDRMIFSGYQNIEGNFETKINKAKKQLNNINTDKHLEYVSMTGEKSQELLEEIVEEFESIGMDESEAKQIAELLDVETSKDKLSSIEGLKLAKELIEEKDLSRVHIHTYRYHLCVTSEDYKISAEKIRKSLLFGEASAIQMADQGSIPNKNDMEEFNLEKKHIHRVEPLEELGHEFSKEEFAAEGIYEDEEFTIVAVPSLIHEDPERLVGMGDIISSGAFTAELK